MKVLVIGGGGREHALAWALHRSAEVTRVCAAPGNAGIARHAERIELAADDVDGLVRHATEQAYDLVVVGPEAPLVAGLADRLQQAGIAVFGCSQAAAQIEGSKVFAKRFMERHDIPTAAFEVFTDAAEAERHLRDPRTVYPLVVKADGLAAGKGVILADDADQAVEAAVGMLTGREASFFILTDGQDYVELATCQDYKRAEDDDRGLNTGGMGTYSPSVYLDDAMRKKIVDQVVAPTIAGMAKEERPYRGVLYIGLMLTDGGPKVLEYNARFGDPETQVLLPRLDGDWFPVLLGCATGRLPDKPLTWKQEASVCVVMAAGGYPGSYEKGRPIEGIEQAETDGDVVVFHAGTTRDAEGRYVTAGGRVLGVTALGADLRAAREKAYRAAKQIHWADEHHRTDIALDAIQQIERGES